MSERLVTVVLEFISGTLLVCLMLVTVIDVVGRYLLNKPLTGAFELTEMLLCALVFASLPLVSREGGHVDVDMLTNQLPEALKRLFSLLAGFVCAAVLLFFAWRLWIMGSHQFADGARSESLAVPFGLFAWFGTAACVLAALFSVMRAYRK